MSDAPTPIEPTRRHVARLLHAQAHDAAVCEARLRALEAEGHRIVSAGQTGAGDEAGSPWEITDWRTGDLLASGTGSGRDLDAAMQPQWYDYEAVWQQVGISEAAPTDGVPPSLATALDDWIGSTSTSDTEIAQWLGWTSAQVRVCRQ